MDSDGKFLVKTIAELIEQAAPDLVRRSPRFSLNMRPSAANLKTAEQIAEELVNEAIRSGLPLRNVKVSRQPLGGGNTAELVSELTLESTFVLKLDSQSEKLAKEAVAMRAARSHKSLSERCRNVWPVIYAIRESAPYAYLMEYFPRNDGWVSLEDRLYPGVGVQATSETDVVRFIHPVLDILFETYADSRDTRTLPNLAEDYVGRIKERLTAVGHDKRFASRPLRINGTLLAPWQQYVDQLDRGMAYIASITPPFTTVAHGDPNPGNVMLRSNLSTVEVKLIDPKEWQTGDYLFDVAKLTHFLLGTGPIEKPASGDPIRVDHLEGPDVAELNYRYEVPAWTQGVVAACTERVTQFAEASGDKHWLARYELGMAANLLGLPAGRLKKNRPDAALALYAEGLLWLKRFCERLPGTGTGSAFPLDDARPMVIEPAALATARQLVRSHAPQVADATDRRGFRLMHWPPTRPNAAGKPVELSLEHEARLTPVSTGDLATLKTALTASDAQVAGNSLLSGHPRFGGLSIRRVARPSGEQSRDRYWDVVPAAGFDTMIARRMTLRERVRTSAFMTWEGDGNQRPLNLELPAVPYGSTGVVARLEFNWIDTVIDMLTEFGTASAEGPADNPLVLASRVAGIGKGAFEPVLEHTTYREKYQILDGELEVFQLNVDHVVAQSLRTQRIATFTDIDIAPSQIVDDGVLASLVAFAQAISDRYKLVPVDATKALTGARMTGVL